MVHYRVFFSRLEFVAGFPLYIINLDGRIGEAEAVLRVKKPKKTGVRTRQNPLVINVRGKHWHIVISNKLVRMVMRNSKVHVAFSY